VPVRSLKTVPQARHANVQKPVEVRRLRELVSLELQRGHITGNPPQRRRSLRR